MYSFWKSVGSSRQSYLTPNSIQILRNEAPILGPSPTSIPYKIITEQSDKNRLIEFLESHFGSPPNTPILNPTLDKNDILLSVTDSINNLCGCIRYSYAGDFEGESIYKIDCFCIHPRWRKKGVGSYLLSALHYETMRRGLCYSIFLKESAPISQIPFYSSEYVFKNYPFKIHNRYSHKIYLPNSQEVLNIIRIYKDVFPDTFILININSPHIEWRFYKQDRYSLLVACQDSFQRFNSSKERIGWITGWLESPRVSWPADRSHILDALVNSFSYKWFWADKNWIQDASGWSLDGEFHWYCYQWKSTLTLSGSYILNV